MFNTNRVFYQTCQLIEVTIDDKQTCGKSSVVDDEYAQPIVLYVACRSAAQIVYTMTTIKHSCVYVQYVYLLIIVENEHNG